MSTNHKRGFFSQAQQYIIAGVLTIIPIWVTLLVFRFLLGVLSDLGQPTVKGLSSALEQSAPVLSRWLLQPWFQSSLAVLWTLAVLYVLGWVATQVIGGRIIAAFDTLMARIPLVQRIYGSTKKLLSALQTKPEGVDRVVLIEFPSADMKAVGFVTRTFVDESSGEELAAVYVPTTPNPTSGYLEIVPVSKVVSTEWSMDDAMAFIMSGGAVAPGRIDYGRRIEVSPLGENDDPGPSGSGTPTPES